MRSIRQLIDAANTRNTTISRAALSELAADADKSEAEVLTEMGKMLDIMEASIEQGMTPDIRSASGLSGGMAYKVKTGRGLSGAFMTDVLSAALAVAELNACMGKIVAAPTAGSCGIIPACLHAVSTHYAPPREKLVMALITASAVGLVIAENASISGAEGGCQAECGAAAAMAAAAVTELLDGSPEACGHAVAQALKSVMGLVCDPVAGLVEEPCVIRNAACAAIAVTAAELSLAGVRSNIPADEVITAMGTVGRQLPACLRETAEGGLAATPAGLRIAAGNAG